MIIDEGPEWRAFDSEQRESRERAGPPSTIMAHDKGLSTSIGWRNKDAYGRQIPHKSRAQIYRLRKWQHRIRTRPCSRSEEHTSELQSQFHLVCRLLLEKKNSIKRE